MNIGIYIGGTPSEEINCADIIENGNPGIGGCEYEFAMLAIYLSKALIHSTDYKFYVFQEGRYKLPDYVRNITGITKSNVLDECQKQSIKLLICDFRWPLTLIKSFNGSETRLIAWCHCVGSIYRHLLLNLWPCVLREIFVSRGHYLNFIDNPVDRKSDYIYNAVSFDKNIDNLREKNPFKNRPHDVVFMGALDESKGFHVLAQAWPEVLKLVPDAKLHIIGSASLYGANPKLGKLGLAEERYEKKFAAYLQTANGELHPSVVMHGKLGNEKYEVMSKCRVGVPNPDGFTETFCICAVEMQLCGCKIVTKWSSGYIDTVPSPNVLVKSAKDLAVEIATCLLEDDFDWKSNIENIKDNFDIEIIGKKWVEIIKGCDTGIHQSPYMKGMLIPKEFRYRVLNARLRKFLPFLPPKGLIADTWRRATGVIKRNLYR